jgi:hypothetical protein
MDALGGLLISVFFLGLGACIAVDAFMLTGRR